MQLLIFVPLFVADPRHIEMLRVQSLLRDRLRKVQETRWNIWSAVVCDHVDPKFRDEVQTLGAAFDFFIDPSQVCAHAGPHSKWGIRRPTNYAIDVLARHFERPSELYLLRVIQDTFVLDVTAFAEDLDAAASGGPEQKFFAASVHHWQTDGNVSLCRRMGLKHTSPVTYAQGAAVMAPWCVWEHYYLGLPPEINHYWDDVMMSMWLTRDGGRLVNIRLSFRHIHHCAPSIAQELYRSQLADLKAVAANA